MVAKPLFMDTGGFYALLSAECGAHKKAAALMEESRHTRRRAVTTD